MAADPSLLVLAEPWRKGTHSGNGGCVEAAVVAAPRPWPVGVATAAEVDISR
jgi:hypothetical protein